MAIKEIVMAAVCILLAAVLIGVLATQQQELIVKDSAENEEHAQVLSKFGINMTNVTVTYPPTSWKVQDCPLTDFSVKNQSGTVLAETTDYVVDRSTGIYYLKNTTATFAGIYGNGVYNKTYVTYRYCPDNYMNQGWGRSILNMLGGFFAILALGIIVYYLYSVYKLKE